MSNNSMYRQSKRGIKAQLQSRFSAFTARMKLVTIKGKRRGFLPFDTNPWDRVFVSTLLMVAIHLLWMRFLAEHITLTVATILTLVLFALIFTRG